MLRTSYSLEDLQTLVSILNEISEKGLTLRQVYLMGQAVDIIDNKNSGIEEVAELEAGKEE